MNAIPKVNQRGHWCLSAIGRTSHQMDAASAATASPTNSTLAWVAVSQASGRSR